VSATPQPDLAIERVLGVGLLASALLLLLGLLQGHEPLLRLGVIVLIGTPAAGVVVVTLALLLRRDFVFALVSLWTLLVLASSLLVALRS
jgi:uncharacterized membrane protein